MHHKVWSPNPPPLALLKHPLILADESQPSVYSPVWGFQTQLCKWRMLSKWLMYQGWRDKLWRCVVCPPLYSWFTHCPFIALVYLRSTKGPSRPDSTHWSKFQHRKRKRKIWPGRFSPSFLISNCGFSSPSLTWFVGWPTGGSGPPLCPQMNTEGCQRDIGPLTFEITLFRKRYYIYITKYECLSLICMQNCTLRILGHTS